MAVSDHAEVAAAFSPAVLKALAAANMGPEAKRVANLLGPNLPPSTSLGAAFDAAHKVLVSEYRNEYTFKNQIVSKIVIGRHSPTTATALIEQPMGSSIADVLVLNGTSTVYEVKTDYDSFARLPTQIENYRRRSEFVSVVVSERRSEIAANHVPEDIGIIAMRPQGSLSEVRPPSSNLARLRHRDLFQLLRTREAVSLVQKFSGDAPSAPAGFLREATYDSFRSFTIEQAHTATVAELKGRGVSARRLLSEPNFPRSLRALAYAIELSAVGATRLQEKMSQSVSEVLAGYYGM